MGPTLSLSMEAKAKSKGTPELDGSEIWRKKTPGMYKIHVNNGIKYHYNQLVSRIFELTFSIVFFFLTCSFLMSIA